MAILDILVNDHVISRVGEKNHSSVSWDIIASVLEQHAILTVAGLVQRRDGNYDSLYWLESYPLASQDRVSFHASESTDTSPPTKIVSHEQHEALRQEVSRAEEAGEFDAARKAPRQCCRASAGLTVRAGSTFSMASDANVTTVVCSGTWSNHHRPAEVRVRLHGVGSPESKVLWHPIANVVEVEIAA